jgi:hypothetical protein
VDCKLANGVIGCGADNKGYGYNLLHPFEGALVLNAKPSNNKNWSIGSNNIISWKTPDQKEVHFSKSKKGSPNQIYAEICSTYGHGDKDSFVTGQAKAYYI